MYSLNRIVESLAVGTLLLVNQHLIYVFLFNTSNNEVMHRCVEPFLMKVRLGVGAHSLCWGTPGWLAVGWDFHTVGRGHPRHLLCPAFRAGFDLQHDAGQRIPTGQVGKAAHFLSCLLICKHGQNLFSTCTLSVTNEGGESFCHKLTFHFAHREAPRGYAERELVCARGLAKLRNLVLSDKRFPSYKSSHGVFLLGHTRAGSGRRKLTGILGSRGCLPSISSPSTDGIPHLFVSLPPIWKSLQRHIWWQPTLVVSSIGRIFPEHREALVHELRRWTKGQHNTNEGRSPNSEILMGLWSSPLPLIGYLTVALFPLLEREADGTYA